MEVKFLKERCAWALRQYYDSKNHQKKQSDSSRFQDLRRDFQAVIGNRTNIEDYGGETFISEELAITILQDTKICFQRCQAVRFYFISSVFFLLITIFLFQLSKPSELASNAVDILETLLQHLLVEHVDYALELGLQAIPINESKAFPQLYFFEIVRRTNAIVHLMERLYTDSVIPLVM